METPAVLTRIWHRWPAPATLAIVLLHLAAASGAAEAPTIRTTDAGRAVSTAFLAELTNPARTVPKYRVGIVLGDLGIGLLISPQGAPVAVEYIAGTGQTTEPWSRALVTAAVEQLRDPRTNDFRFRVMRKILTAQNCPQIAAGIAELHAGLKAALSAPIDLAGRPPLAAGITTHGGSIRIQVAVYSAVLSLDRIGELRHPLAGVLNQMVMELVNCADRIPAAAEQDYSFSYGQANPHPLP